MQLPPRERKRKRRSPPCGSFYLVVREDPRLRTGAPVVPEFKIIEDGVLQIIGRPLFSLACIGLCRPAKAGRGVTERQSRMEARMRTRSRMGVLPACS